MTASNPVSAQDKGELPPIVPAEANTVGTTNSTLRTLRIIADIALTSPETEDHVPPSRELKTGLAKAHRKGSSDRHLGIVGPPKSQSSLSDMAASTSLFASQILVP
jgi:hypothetical protein